MLRDFEFSHQPVLFAQCINALNIGSGGIYLDCTAGGGGHSIGILEQLDGKGTLISIDKDESALNACRAKMEQGNFSGKWILVKSDFSNIDKVLEDLDILNLDGVLADLGVSSHQLDTAERGFSYVSDGPLDMRMDPEQRLSARVVVNEYDEADLARIIRDYGEEKFSKRIAGRIVENRRIAEITSTVKLAEIVARAMPSKAKKEDQHPARRTFQAIRIEVNSELSAIQKLLEFIPQRLNKGGRFAVISFHSLEDRLVKEAFKNLESPCTCPREFPVCICGKKPLGKMVTGKPITADTEEIKENKRSKSAKLRVFERNGEAWTPLR